MLGGHTRLLGTSFDSLQEETEASQPLEEPEPLSPRLGPAVSERAGRSLTCSRRGCGSVGAGRQVGTARAADP